MAENEFEKNVRKEMDGFKVHPSEEIWPKIEERIRENKRKRRILFFILFASVALMLGGYGIYNFSGNTTKSKTQDKLSELNRPNNENKTGTSKNEERSQETIAIKPTIPAQNIKNTSKTPIAARQRRISPDKEDRRMASASGKKQNSKDITTPGVSKSDKKLDNHVSSDSTKRENTSASPVAQQPIIPDKNQNEVTKQDDKNSTPNDSTGSKLAESKDTRHDQAVNKKKENKIPGNIVWGINFSAGTSVITEEAFSFKSSSAAADAAYASPPPVTGGGGQGAYYRYPQSQNKPAFAFKVGVNTSKNISKRSSFSVGLSYSYLADKIKVGTSQGLLSQSPSAFLMSYYTGSPYQTYTDHFHFIELPLSYNWRMTNNADHFLSLNAGISPSYLLATNALLYDTATGGVYYHNKDLITRTHLNFISGISYQFKNRNNLAFSLGPQFSFDVSEVFKSELDKRKYFLYTGIEARIRFLKKKK